MDKMFLRLLVCHDMPRHTSVFMYRSDTVDQIGDHVCGFGRFGVGGSRHVAATVDATAFARMLTDNARWMRNDDAFIVFVVNSDDLTMSLSLECGCFTATLTLPILYGNNVPLLMFKELPIQEMNGKGHSLDTWSMDEVSFPSIKRMGVPLNMNRVLDTGSIHIRHWKWQTHGHRYGFCYWASPCVSLKGTPHHPFFVKKFHFIPSIEQSIAKYSVETQPWQVREQLMLAYGRMERAHYKSYFHFFKVLYERANFELEFTTLNLYRDTRDPVSFRYAERNFILSCEDCMLETMVRLELHEARLKCGTRCTVRNNRLFIDKK